LKNSDEILSADKYEHFMLAKQTQKQSTVFFWDSSGISSRNQQTSPIFTHIATKLLKHLYYTYYDFLLCIRAVTPEEFNSYNLAITNM